jgi:speckle-type POZ protein
MATTAESSEELRWRVYQEKPCSAPSPPPTAAFESEQKPDFRKDIGSLLEDTSFADVTFVLEGDEVKAHRNVLAARSPTFKAMFTSGLSESISGAVVRLSGKKSTFEAMLKYIYSDQVSIPDVDAAIDLLAMAEEYFLPGLKSECADVLMGKYLTEDTAVSLFQVASMFRAAVLKEKCAEFILRNTASINLADLGKDMLAELLLIACSMKQQVAEPMSADAFGPAGGPAFRTTCLQPASFG